MLKFELRDLVRSIVGRNDQEDMFPVRMVEYVLEAATNQLYIDLFKERESLLDPFIVTTAVPTIGITEYTDDNRAYGYVEYPWFSDILGVTHTLSVVPLPDKAGGVRAVRIRSGTVGGVNFLPMTREEGEFYSSTTLASTDTYTSVVGYVTLRDRIDLYGPSALFIQINNLYIDYIPTFSCLDDTAQVTESYGQTARVIQLVYQILGIEPPLDLKDDNSPQIWQSKMQQKQ